MIFFIFSLSVFLPYLNRDNCDDPGIGYTCKDLEDGVNKLQILLKRERNFSISYHTFSKNIYNQIIIRLYTVVLALATDSIPAMGIQLMDKLLINDEKTQSKKPIVNPPCIAHVLKKIKSSTFFPICFNESSLTNNIFFQSEMPPMIKPLFLNPSIYRLTEYLGPAAYHILIHFALNITSFSTNSSESNDLHISTDFKRINFRNKSGFAVLSPMPLNATCINECMSKKQKNKKGSKVISLDATTSLEDLLKTMNIENFGYQIGDIGGVVMTLLRGVPSFIYDPVSKACYKGRSIISGALNPIYSGIYRSNSDLSRGGADFCHNSEITKTLLKKLL